MLNKAQGSLMLAMLMFSLLGCEGTTDGVNNNQVKADTPLFIIHFFDWYANKGEVINGPHWTHKVDWAKYGLTDQDICRTSKYYDNQFDLLNKLGVDGISFETYSQDKSMAHPSEIAISSMRSHNIKIGAFFDWELEHAAGKPELSIDDYIKPDPKIGSDVAKQISDFYSYIPKELWLSDKQGRLPIFFFAFGFDEHDQNSPDTWQHFYKTMVDGLEQKLGQPVVIYWSARNVWPLEYGFQHLPDRIRPYNFVLDTMQHQIGHNEVTWNVNYDNLGVQRQYKTLLRVIRDDPRYLQEMYWLAKFTAPEVVFIYSWNEYYEGANIMPDETYGDTRFNLVQAMIKDVHDNSKDLLPRTLLVVDDFSGDWHSNDWHNAAQEQAVVFPLRRYIPQSDYMMVSEAKTKDLAKYQIIVSMQRSDPSFDTTLRRLADAGKQIIFYHPLPSQNTDMTNYFATKVEYMDRNRNIDVYNVEGIKLETVMAHDDTMSITPKADAQTLLYALDGPERVPLLLRRNNSYWLNYYWPDETILVQLFSTIYSWPLEQAILFGGGMQSQRLEVDAKGAVTQKTFNAPAIYQHLPLPVSFTAPPPAEVPGQSK